MRKLFWPHMANDGYDTGDQCRSCARNGNRYRHKRSLQLFPLSGSLDFVAIDILRQLSKTTSKNRYVVVITDRYSKLTRAIMSSKTALAHIVNTFLDQRIIPYGIRSFILTDNRSQIVSKVFATLCGLLGVKHLTTTASCPQTNSQAEQFNKTVATRLRHFVGEHQQHWIDLYNRSPMCTIHSYTGPPTIRCTASCYLDSPRDLQHSTLVTPYRLTRIAILLHEPCNNNSKNKSKFYAAKRTLICVGHHSGLNRIKTVAFA